MRLQNRKYSINITVEDACAPVSLPHGKIIFDPLPHDPGDPLRIFMIDVCTQADTYAFSLIGDPLCHAENCAVLEDDLLTVLQNQYIAQFDLSAGTMRSYQPVEGFGCNFSIFQTENGYLLYGEEQILMLDHHLNRKWSFSGKEIFVSLTKGMYFEITENDRIRVYDFDDRLYELDLNGRLLRETLTNT